MHHDEEGDLAPNSHDSQDAQKDLFVSAFFFFEFVPIKHERVWRSNKKFHGKI